MALILMQHPNGPKLPQEIKGRKFRSYVDLANWADEHLPYGLYYVRNHNAATLATMRELTHQEGKFYVEGYGHV